MKQTNDFLIPDYFPDFHCKMGDCRAACCQGWPISVSMTNYFTLLGMDCPPHLRSRLDVGLRMVDYPTEDEYARFNPRWDGDCPMRMEDGRCSLHAEVGEDVLPEVCRLYPRGIRHGDSGELCECSCANSCEATLELFLGRTEPLTFITRRLTLDMPRAAKRTYFFGTLDRGQELRLFFLRIMQDRSMHLPERMVRLGITVTAMENALDAHDTDAVQAILNGTDAHLSEGVPAPIPFELALDAAETLTYLLDHRSTSIRERGQQALSVFGKGEDAHARYIAAREHFEALFPDWEIFFEHMLVNHMFFDRFPFQDRPVTLPEEMVSLTVVYTLLRFLALGWMADKTDPAELIDTMAAAFRLIEHTDFDRLAARMLKQLGFTSPAQLYALIRL